MDIKSCKKHKIVLIAIMATALAATPAFVGIQQVLAAGNLKTIEGSGSGQLRCGTTLAVPVTSEIAFRADKQGGKITGTFKVDANFATKQGIITGGKVSASSFTLTGVENQNRACIGDPLTTVTITGTCGSGVDIFFRSAAGERGQYVGTVSCTS